jgi:hypothetical protein
VAAGESTSRYAEELTWDQDLIVQRATVPSVEQPQGEVQLIQRRDLLVVQTLLSSRVLKKVAAAIDAKESRNWPEAQQGYIESLRYRDELFRATEESWEAFRQRSDRSQDRQTLAIEFILGPKISLIALSLPHLSVDKGNLLLIDKRLLKIWRSNEDYVRENMFEIVKNSFHLSDTTAEKLLTPLWPGGRRSAARD